MLNPGYDGRTDGAEPQAVDRLETGLLKERFKLLKRVSVANVPAVLDARHANRAGMGLPVSVGSGDIDKPIVVEEIVDLPQPQSSVRTGLSVVPLRNILTTFDLSRLTQLVPGNIAYFNQSRARAVVDRFSV